MATFKPKNIYIVGAQCTGKTSLVNALASSFDQSLNVPPPAGIKEVARSVLKHHGFTASDITSDSRRCARLQSLILKAQFDREREVLKEGEWIVSDRSGVDPLVYAHRHVGVGAMENMMSSDYWKELRTRMSRSLIFVCEAGTDWLVDDGVRLMPTDVQDWIAYHREFCQILDRARLAYQVIPCSMLSLDERASFVWSIWKEEVASAK